MSIRITYLQDVLNIKWSIFVDNIEVYSSWQLDRDILERLYDDRAADNYKKSAIIINELNKLRPIDWRRNRDRTYCEMGKHFITEIERNIYYFSHLDIQCCKECMDKHIEDNFQV